MKLLARMRAVRQLETRVLYDWFWHFCFFLRTALFNHKLVITATVVRVQPRNSRVLFDLEL